MWDGGAASEKATMTRARTKEAFMIAVGPAEVELLSQIVWLAGVAAVIRIPRIRRR